MICFITDIRPGEPDILTPVADNDLTIHDALNQQELKRIPAPHGGWTHALLEQQAERLADTFSPALALDARLDGQFVGSTEV